MDMGFGDLVTINRQNRDKDKIKKQGKLRDGKTGWVNYNYV